MRKMITLTLYMVALKVLDFIDSLQNKKNQVFKRETLSSKNKKK